MKKFIYILVILTVSTVSNLKLYSQFIQNSSKSLFSDVKAFKDGDAIMVLIMESVQADNGASTQDSRSTSLNAGLSLPAALSNTNIGTSLGTDNSFKSSGNTSRNERIRTRLSARVVGVEPNGNLQIEGKRTTKINGEVQTIIIKGVVRPVDVLPDNSIFSYSILDLTLLIEGEGSITETQNPGLITKFLRFLF